MQTRTQYVEINSGDVLSAFDSRALFTGIEQCIEIEIKALKHIEFF